MTRSRRFAFIPICVVQIVAGLVLLGMLSMLRARPAADGQQAGVTLTFSCSAGLDGVLRINIIPIVTPHNSQSAPDAFLATQLQQAFASQPAGWQDSPSFKVPGAFKSWLRETLKNCGMPISVIVDNRTGTDSLWNVGAMISATPYAGLCVVLPTTALAAGSPDITVPATQLDGSPAALWQNSSIRLVGTRAFTTAATGVDALKTIRKVAAQTVAASCAAYARSQDWLTCTNEIQAFAVKQISTQLGPPYTVNVSFASSQSASGPPVLDVILKNLDPLFATRVAVTQVDLPASLGGRMTMDAFSARFGSSRLGRRIMADQERCRDEVRRALADLLPANGFPRFLSDTERSEISQKLSTLTGVALVTYHEIDGTLVFDVLYTPPQGSLTLSLNGNSSRELSGSLNFSYHWQNGPQLSAQGTLGLTSTSLSASAGNTTHPLGAGWSFKTDVEAAYERDQQVRLGTRDGPLVTIFDSSAGGRLMLTYDSGVIPAGTSRTHMLHAESSLYARERWLQGNGASSFLGQPDSLSGPALTVCQKITRDNSPSADANTPPSFIGNRITTASAEITQWFPSGQPSYASGRLSASIHQDLGGLTPSDAYVELRGSAGLADPSAPRIDFFRLGGDNGLFGLDDGELAGRSFETGALEAGYSLGALVRSASGSPAKTDNAQPSKLDAFYAFALVEYGHIGRQEDAGADFNPYHTAASYALGGRFGGAVPGLGAAASISFGYAWSPESIRRTGRFFTSVVIPFGN